MDGVDWLESLGGATPAAPVMDWSDVLLKATEQPDPVGWLMTEMDAPNRRTPERWLAAIGEGARGGRIGQEPRREPYRSRAERLVADLQADADEAAEAQRLADAAELLRGMRRVHPGHVKVVPKSDLTGTPGERNISEWLDIDFAAVAEALEDGDVLEAAELLSDEIMNAYGGASEPELGSAYLEIVDCVDGIDWR